MSTAFFSEKMEELTRKYRRFIVDKYATIPCLDEGISLTMENYIPLRLGEEKKHERPKEKREEGVKEASDIDFRVWREEHSFGEIYSLTPVDVWRAIRNKKIVVKGDPGSGKTTLTRYIAYSLCRDRNKSCPNERATDLIPLVIDLKDWASKGGITLSEYSAKYALKNSGFEKTIKPLTEHWLKSGKCIILCDGLDEIAQKNKDSTIQSLQNLASGDYKNCHILVTTRIVGYNNELSGWQHYEVMSLKKENISQYAEDYFKKKNPPFLSALKKTPQMGPFSKNPLLLQILCFVFDKQKLVLPARRVELYKTAVREMLGLRKPEIPFPIKEKVLQEIAYCLLEGKEVFEEGDLREIIKGSLERAKEKYDVDDVLKEIVEKSGLLCRLSDDRYIFLHLTFQEYLCACHLTEREENPCQILEPVLFNARYREVITLTAGMLFKEKASRFIDFILSQKPLCYEVLHQPLLLAGMCIADILDDKADPSVEEKIRNELWRLWKKTELDPLRNEISRVFTSFAGTRNEEKIINSLLEVLKDKSKWVRGNAAEALGDLGRADDRVIDGLLGLLKDEDDFVHGRAAAALGKLGRADDRVIDGLLGLLKGKSVWACINADEALVNLGRADDRVIDGLLGLLKDEDEFVRSDAADALGNLGRADDRVIDTLLGLLKDEDDLARSDAARTLGKLGRADDRVIDELLGLLKDEDDFVRSDAAEALGKLGRADDRVIDTLLGLLKDEDDFVRSDAAEALVNLGRTDDRVIDTLLGLLKDKSEWVCGRAAEALGKLGRADDRVIDKLLGLLKDKSEWVRDHAAEALDKLGRADDRVIDGLLGLLKGKSVWACINAAEALGKLGRADDRVIDELLGLLKDEDDFVRSDAAEALGKLGRADDKVIDELLKLLNKDLSWVRSNAYSGLQKLAEKQARKTSARLPSPILQASVDTFFQKKQDTIEELAEKFSTYQNRVSPITEETIKEWLLQFGNLSWMELALKLLERIDYYTPHRMREMFRHFYRKIMPEEDRARVVCSLLGNLEDSSALINYFLGKVFMEYRLTKPQPLETILDNMEPEEKVIVFVDDNIGSGKQAVQIFREWLGKEERIIGESHVKPLSKKHIKKFKCFKIYLCTFVGFEEGKKRVREELEENGLNVGEVYSFIRLEEAIGCFHAASDIFANPEELKEAKEMVSEIGIQLFKDKDWKDELKKERSLGYGNSQKLIVFFYNTPTSTLPILWKEGEYNGRRWQPLFPRREKR